MTPTIDKRLIAEQSILKWIVVDGSLMKKVGSRIDAGHFSSTKNQNIFTAMIKLRRKGYPIDMVTIAGFLKDDGILIETGGCDYLMKILSVKTSKADLSNSIRIILSNS
jgi:replicative DNA helicase